MTEGDITIDTLLKDYDNPDRCGFSRYELRGQIACLLDGHLLGVNDSDVDLDERRIFVHTPESTEVVLDYSDDSLSVSFGRHKFDLPEAVNLSGEVDVLLNRVATR